MRIKKINKIEPMTLIPREHWRWCGLETKKRSKKEPEIEHGDLILYDRHGNLITHKGENNGAKEKVKED